MEQVANGGFESSPGFPQIIDELGSNVDFASRIIRSVVALSGEVDLLGQIQHDLPDRRSLVTNAGLFDWLLSMFSYQGVSDSIARGYIDQHGGIGYADIADAPLTLSVCPKLAGYFEFNGCRYDKTSRTCSEPDHIDCCSLPKHNLRNGRLNQTAYSLFLFIRDIAGGDLVGWIDEQLEQADRPDAPDRVERMRAALTEPLKQVYGISSKVISMTFADLLMGARGRHERWFLTGSHMIAVDTLIHNFLDRTGILMSLDAEHRYGPACYRNGGCASIIRAAANSIDARQFNPTYPAVFPRFVQHAIWRFCAQDGLDLCNGNQIRAGEPCGQAACPAFLKCATADENFKKQAINY